MERKNWPMLVLSSSGTLSPIQLQKALFLIGEELSSDIDNEYYHFEPYDYGPFDSDIYRDCEELEREGFVVIDNPFYRAMRRYSLSNQGMELVDKLKEDIDERIIEEVDRIVLWTKSKSFPDLVRSIYEEYPEFKENSVFKDA